MTQSTEAGSAAQAPPVVGEWAVARDAWAIRVGRIDKITAQTVLLTLEKRLELKRVDRNRLLFHGAEPAAKRLAAQIISSEAQRDEDQRNAGIKHEWRVKAFVLAAMDGEP